VNAALIDAAGNGQVREDILDLVRQAARVDAGQVIRPAGGRLALAHGITRDALV
jgi:hypothetical protein